MSYLSFVFPANLTSVQKNVSSKRYFFWNLRLRSLTYHFKAIKLILSPLFYFSWRIHHIQHSWKHQKVSTQNLFQLSLQLSDIHTSVFKLFIILIKKWTPHKWFQTNYLIDIDIYLFKKKSRIIKHDIRSHALYFSFLMHLGVYYY